MTTQEVNHYKLLLISKREEVLKGGRIRRGSDPAIPEPTGTADLARTAQDTDVGEQLRQADSRLLRAIEDALERIRRGDFGVCASCDRPIGHARLKPVPRST